MVFGIRKNLLGNGRRQLLYIQSAPGGKVTILGGYSIDHSMQQVLYVVCTGVLFQTLSEIELLHYTVVWIWRPALFFPVACESV
jgi:hypothetical protein